MTAEPEAVIAAREAGAAHILAVEVRRRFARRVVVANVARIAANRAHAEADEALARAVTDENLKMEAADRAWARAFEVMS